MQKMTLARLFISIRESIRERIYKSIEADDRKTLGEIHLALTIVLEASYASKDVAFIEMVTHMKDVLRMVGWEWGLKKPCHPSKILKKPV